MGGLDLPVFLSHLVIYVVVLLLAVSVHEAGHAWTSYKFGDNTAHSLGRVTLNPIAHTDPIGTLLIPILGFVFGAMGGFLGTVPLLGWGKPTPVNPRNWTNYKLANVMVSIAGVLANIGVALLSVIILKILLVTGVFAAETLGDANNPFTILFTNLIFLNISLFIFNLLPFPPLDGSKILSTFLPASFQPVLDVLEQYGFMILILLMYFGIIRAITAPIFAFIMYLIRSFLV